MNQVAAVLVGALVGCMATACRGGTANTERVESAYDKQTGKLSQLTVDAAKDGKPNIFSYMDGSRFIRIEIDKDEDGKIDRWEYYAADGKLERVGLSRANDGKPDAWAYQAADGSIGRMEVSTRRDGKIDRTEFYEGNALVRAQEDTNHDGRVDKWETYADGALMSVAFDTSADGKPDHTIDYRK